MRTLTNSTSTLRLSFPRTWYPSDLTAVSVQISDFDGNELLASTSADLYDAASLSVDASRYSREISLSPGDGELLIGDLIRISGVEGYEDHTVKGWSPSDLTAELEEFVDRDFEAGATVHRLSAVATVDLSDAEVFPPGIQLVITWTPTGTGSAITELSEIESSAQVDVASFTEDFKALYPRAYSALTKPADRLDVIIRLAIDEMRLDMSSRMLDISRIKDQSLISPPLMAKVAEMSVRGGDKQSSDELETYTRAYSAALESLCSNPFWNDLDGDGRQDEGEVDTYPEIFERVW